MMERSSMLRGIGEDDLLGGSYILVPYVGGCIAAPEVELYSWTTRYKSLFAK